MTAAMPTSGPPSSRSRCKDVDKIYVVLAKHINDPHGILYTEELKGVSNPLVLDKHTDMLDEIRDELPPDGALEQSATAAALKRHAVAQEETWHLSKESGPWSIRTAKKVRAMSRHHSQRQHKKQGKFARACMKKPAGKKTKTKTKANKKKRKKRKRGDSAGTAENKSAEAPAAATDLDDEDSEWSYGYDDHLQAMWKRSKHGKKKAKSHCVKYIVPPGADKDSYAVAVWADGVEKTCSHTTCEKAQEREAPKLEGQRAAAETWWKGETAKGTQLHLRKVFRKGEQWAQLWDPDAAKQIFQCTDTSPLMVDWMIHASKEYAAGKISKTQVEVMKKAKIAEEKETKKKRSKKGRKESCSNTSEEKR